MVFGYIYLCICFLQLFDLHIEAVNLRLQNVDISCLDVWHFIDFLPQSSFTTLFHHCLPSLICLTAHVSLPHPGPFLPFQLKMETTGGCWTLVLTSWQPQPRVTPGSLRGFICLTTWTRRDALTLCWRRFGSSSSCLCSVNTTIRHTCRVISSPHVLSNFLFSLILPSGSCGARYRRPPVPYSRHLGSIWPLQPVWAQQRTGRSGRRDRAGGEALVVDLLLPVWHFTPTLAAEKCLNSLSGQRRFRRTTAEGDIQSHRYQHLCSRSCDTEISST